MPVIRIVLGVIFGAVTLAAALVAAAYLGFSLAATAIGWCVVVAAVFDLYVARKSKLALATYWKRKCTGSVWKRRFHDSSKASIREFLALFVSAFGCPRRQLKFSPDDRIIDIYRSFYPNRSTPDNFELETLAQHLQDRYGIDLETIWHDEITLGELYAQATAL